MKLLEGKYDQITGTIVDAIWIVIKKSKEVYDNTGNSLYATKTEKTPDFKIQIIIKREKGAAYYKVDANTYNNKIVFSLELDPETEPEVYSELNTELQGTVRHEIEHLLQEKNVPEKAKFPSTYMLKKINKNVYKYLIADHEVEAMVKGFYRKAKTKKEKLDIVIDDFLRYFIKDKSITRKQAKEIKDKWINYAKQNLPVALYKKITEAQHFERGLDPKDAMDIGLLRWENLKNETILKSIKNIRINPQNEISDKSDYNIQLKGLFFIISDVQKHDDGCVSFTYYNYEDLKDAVKQLRGIINVQHWVSNGFILGTIKQLNDHFEILQKYNLKEAQYFKRGLDPKDAMQTGDIVERARQQIKAVITKLAEKYSSYEPDQIIETILPDNIIKYGFYKTYGLETWEFYVGYRKIDDSFIPKWFAGWQKVNETWQNKQPIEGQPNGNTDLHFNNLDECIKKLESKLNINEAQHFTRGLDPKDALSIGDVVHRVFEKGKQKVKKAIQILADKNNSKDVYEEYPESDTELSCSIGFYKTKTLKYLINYSVWISGNPLHVSHEQYCASFATPHNPNGEDNTSNDYCFNNLKDAINTIMDWIVDKVGDKYDWGNWSDKIEETQHFTRGLDPKQAMSIGIKPEIIKVAKDAIGQVGSIFFDISEEVLGNIIDFLLEKKYTVEQIKRLILESRHIEWSFTTVNSYDVEVFKKYYKINLNDVKGFLAGTSNKGLKDNYK